MENPESSSEGERIVRPIRTIPQFKSFKSAAVVTAPPVAQEPPKEEKKTERSEDRRKRRHEDDDRSDRHHRHHRHRSRERRSDESDEDRRRRREKDRYRNGTRDRDRDRDRDRRHRDDDKRHHRHHRRSSSRSRSRDRDRHISRHKSPAKKDQDAKGEIIPWETEEVKFIVDRRGDPHNITYGTIHRYNIPAYYRFGGGRVIGLPRRMRIDKDKGDGKGLVILESKSSYSDDKRLSGAAGHIFAVEKSKPLRVKKGGDAGEQFEQGDDFVALSSIRGRRKKVGGVCGEEGNETWKSNVDYRSIHGMEKAKDTGDVSDSELEEASSASEREIEVFNSATREKTIRLTRLVDNEPNNIDAWFEFVEHQEAMMLGTEEGRRRKVRQGERQSLEEVKASIFEKALAKNRGNARLLVAYMETGARIWDPPRLKFKWQDTLKANPSLIELWMRYLNFRMTDIASFRYRDCIQEFENCLDMLRNAVHVYGLSNLEKERLEDVILYVFLRLTLFVKEAGFSELATASWQCLLELNTTLPKEFTPPETHQEHLEVIKSLEAFWDSEVLRIGEVGAKGWDAYASEDIGDFPDPKDADSNDPLKLNIDDPYLFEAWAERENELSHRAPARTTDEVEEDDPYQVILFSDMKGFIYCFQTETIRHKLGYAFLNFCGVMIPQSFSLDPLIRNDLAVMEEGYLASWFWPRQEEKVKLISWVDGEAMEPERKSGFSRSPFGFMSPYIPLAPDNVCVDNSHWFTALINVNGLKTDVEFIARIVKQLTMRTSDEYLALIYLSIEGYKDPKGVKKAAKAFLKKFSDSLLLFNAYAQLEWRAGNVDAARNVFMAALGMSKDLPEDKRKDAILLWHTWVWEELGLNQQTRAMRLLISIPDGVYTDEEDEDEEPSGAALLRARRYLDENRHYSMSDNNYNHATMYTTCLALLEYITSKTNAIELPLQLFKGLEADFKQRRLEAEEFHEQLLLAKCRFLYLHMTTSKHFKAQLLRDILEYAIPLFLNNTAFLSLYAWNEGRTRIENRVRTMIQDIVLKEGNETTNGFVFAIWSEMQMDISRVNANAIRNLFERAVENERTRSSVELWTLYLQFEVTQQHDPKRAKDVLFRAIRACPWCKDIAMMAFTRLATALGFEEMRKIHAVMVEKELRIHVDIEETLEDWDDKYGRTKEVRTLDPSVSVKPLPEDPVSEDEVDED